VLAAASGSRRKKATLPQDQRDVAGATIARPTRTAMTRMSDNEHPPGSLLAKDTTPTWEMELLISGVTVFALLQLAGLLDQAYLALRPKLDVDWDSLTRLLFAYSKMSVLTLAVAFVLHLILRAHWIALVGMNSIYPDGVRWDRLKIGAIKQRLIEQRGITLVNRIEAADNRSSIVFALGVTFALTLACLALLVSLGFAISALLVRLLDWPWLMPNGTFAVVALVALPYALAHLLDRGFGKRLGADGRTARAIAWIYRAYARVGYGSDNNSTLTLLQSHVGERKVFALTLVSILFIAAIVMGQLALQQGRFSIGDYANWPDAELGAVDSVIDQHYRDQAGQTDALLPSIDSMFPRGDYLSLIVPFNPRRHPALLAETCPGIWQAADTFSQRQPLLECMAQLQQLTVDGQAQQMLTPRFYSDPRTAQQGMLMVVPIRNLGAGEHVLGLKRPLAANGDKSDPGRARYQIAFWK